eukprot:491804_1
MTSLVSLRAQYRQIINHDIKHIGDQLQSITYNITDIEFNPSRIHIFKTIATQKDNEIYFLYHGTQKKNISLICNHGFNPWLCCERATNYHGVGSYFSTDIKTAMAFGRQGHQNRNIKSKTTSTVIFSKVIINKTRVCVGNQDMICSNHFDTFTSKNQSIYVITNAYHVVPLCVITFEMEESQLRKETKAPLSNHSNEMKTESYHESINKMKFRLAIATAVKRKAITNAKHTMQNNNRNRNTKTSPVSLSKKKSYDMGCVVNKRGIKRQRDQETEAYDMGCVVNKRGIKRQRDQETEAYDMGCVVRKIMSKEDIQKASIQKKQYTNTNTIICKKEIERQTNVIEFMYCDERQTKRTYRAKLSSEFKVEQVNDLFACNICDMCSTNHDTCRKHGKRSHGPVKRGDPLGIRKAQKGPSSKNYLYVTFDDQKDKKLFRCLFCNKDYASQKTVMNHITTTHAQTERYKKWNA